MDAKRSLRVHGITAADSDTDIVDTFNQYGKVVKVVREVNTAQGETTVIVVFDSEAPVTHLEPDFPLDIESIADTTTKWCVDRLDTPVPPTYPTPARVTTPPDSSSSSESDDSECSEHSTTPLLRRTRTKTDYKKPDPLLLPPASKTTPQPGTRSKVRSTKEIRLDDDDVVNPPEVQRLVVEHVIKNDASTTRNQSKWLRSFSGKVPKPAGETDYETWCLHVELMTHDRVPEEVQRRKILESLLPPASDVIKQLGSSASPQAYVKLLDSAYGVVEDGEEIFAKFLNTNQNPGEKASEYLQRLQVLLNTAVKRKGIKPKDANRQLLKQFKRGCWDHTLIMQLELKSMKALDFSELLLEVRTEEDRRATKMDRMHRHFGSSKVKPTANTQAVSVVDSFTNPNDGVLQAYISETEKLRKQVAELQTQLSTKKPKRGKKPQQEPAETQQPASRVEAQAHQATPKPPRPWFCFKCGENGHIAKGCENPANKPAVAKKYEELRAKQDQWKAEQGLSSNFPRFQ